MPAPLLELENLQKYFPVSTGALLRRKLGWVKAVDGVDIAIYPGETLGLIGESGCGKTTTSKLILLQEAPTSGTIRFDGEDISTLGGQELMRYRREVQVVFQDPYSSLSPRMRVGDIIAEPLEIHTDLSRQALAQRVADVLELVGLQPEVARLFPHEFSGGHARRTSRVAVGYGRSAERARPAPRFPFSPALSPCHAAMRDRSSDPQRGRPPARRGMPSLLSPPRSLWRAALRASSVCLRGGRDTEKIEGAVLRAGGGGEAGGEAIAHKADDIAGRYVSRFSSVSRVSASRKGLSQRMRWMRGKRIATPDLWRGQRRGRARSPPRGSLPGPPR